MTTLRLAYTPGEPAGIGPDLILKLAKDAFPVEVVVFANTEMLKQRASVLGVDIHFQEVDYQRPAEPNGSGYLMVHNTHLHEPKALGNPHPLNREGVLESLKQAYQACADGLCQALVTGPVNKAVLNTTEKPFLGHTEYFAQLAEASSIMMAFQHPKCWVGLVTSHIPLRDVADAITAERLTTCITLLHQALLAQGHENPLIGVLGLNPHAGESGLLGQEEKETLEPLLETLRLKGLNLIGPLPGDTAFIPKNLERFNGLLALYHDQGLAPLKALGFGEVVNVTLGLPIIRTSVDHGTAFDLAGSGTADPKSLKAALDYALHLITKKKSTRS